MSVVKRKRKESPFEVFHHLTKMRQIINENISDMQPRVALTTIEGTTFTFKLENYTNLKKVYVILPDRLML